MFNFCDNTSRNATPQCFIPVRDATLPSRGVLGVQYELKALYLFANRKKVLSKCQAKAGGEKQQRQEQVRRGVSTHGESVNAEAAVSHGVVKGGLSPCVCVCMFLLVITPLLAAFDTHTHTYRASTMPLVLAARLFPSVHGNARPDPQVTGAPPYTEGEKSSIRPAEFPGPDPQGVQQMCVSSYK